VGSPTFHFVVMTGVQQRSLYKISDVARQTGVSTGTIKFYMREGLLPPPTVKTGRNMAYYDRSFVDRIRAIKELQRKRFLPLDVIKAILDRDEEVVSRREVDTLLRLEGRLYQEIQYTPSGERVERPGVPVRYGIDDDLVGYCIASGILTPVRRDGRDGFEGDDLAILESLAEMKRAGFDEGLIVGHPCIELYMDAIGRLAREELKLFSRAVTGKVDAARLAEMALAGVRHMEPLICLLRRKLLLRCLQELRADSEIEATGTHS
jgi:DNA-binding transcriptional MerR regulator